MGLSLRRRRRRGGKKESRKKYNYTLKTYHAPALKLRSRQFIDCVRVTL
jgi:hypothetical protein